MNGSSDAYVQANDDPRHAAAIEHARRQAEAARARGFGGNPGTQTAGSASAVATAWQVDSLPGYDIGPEIHRGGQGVVYRSVQHGTRREVAIKVMREGPFGGPREKARFEREIQILGQLKHPNIVTIHESGTSAHGFYFVMDYIAGKTLDAYVAGANLSVRQVLALFAKICHAVNVAHLRGVIHRDLKPGNIRVDPAGEPHVLDFGLAKVNEDDDLAWGETLVRSVTGQFIGSLPWASPEQLEGRPSDIDVRTDVYALGVVLYQILTGRLPHEIGGNVRQVLDNICRADARAPSAVREGIDGEVDAIVLKCLRKDRAERYQSAGDIARDIERYLGGEPIEAKRDSAWYVVSKQLRRHRLAVSMAGLVVMVMAGALAVSLAFWRQAAHDRDAAQTAQRQADAALAEARRQEQVAHSVVGFLTQDVLRKLDPYTMQGEALPARALFDQAAEDIERGAFADQPLVELEVRTILGLVSEWMSESSRAEAQFRAALAIARAELGPAHDKTLQTMRRLGTSLSSQGKLEEAESLLREAAAARERASGPDHLETIISKSALAGWYVDADRLEEAEALYRRVLADRIRVQGSEHPDTLVVMNNLAECLLKRGQHEEAEALFRKTLAINRALHEEHPETLIGCMNLANVLWLTGRGEEALPLAENAYAGLRKGMGESHRLTRTARLVLAMTHESLGAWAAAEPLFREALADLRDHGQGKQNFFQLAIRLAANMSRQGKLTESEALLREALREHESRKGSVNDRMALLSNLILTLGEQKKGEEALPIAAEAAELSRLEWGDDNEYTIVARNNYGFALLNVGRHADAEGVFRAALAAGQRVYGDDHAMTLNLMHNLAISLGDQQKHEEQESLLRAALNGRRNLLGNQDPHTLKTMHALATMLKDLGRLDEAEVLYREATTTAEQAWPDGHYLTEHFRRGLGICLTAMGRFEEAQTQLLLSREREQTLLRPDHPNHVEGIEKLIELYEAWDKPAEAEKWRMRLESDERVGGRTEP